MEWTYDPITNSSYTDPNTWEIYTKPGNIRDNKDGTKSIYLDNKWRELDPPKWYDQLQEHDWWTLGSIAGDLAGLGLSAAGFTPAATVSGILSTGAQFVSDIKRDELKEAWPESNLFVNMSVINLIIMVFSLFNWIFARFSFYFQIYTFILLPFIIVKLFEKRERGLVYYGFIVCYLLFFLIEENGLIYKSNFIGVFQKIYWRNK